MMFILILFNFPELQIYEYKRIADKTPSTEWFVIIYQSSTPYIPIYFFQFFVVANMQWWELFKWVGNNYKISYNMVW